MSSSYRACSVCGAILEQDGVTFAVGERPVLSACGSCEPNVRAGARIGTELVATKLRATLEERLPPGAGDALRSVFQLVRAAQGDGR